MRPRSSRTMRHFTHVYLHAQTTADVGDIRTWQTVVILITGKTWRPPIWAPCPDKNGASSGISLVYMWDRQIVWPTKTLKFQDLWTTVTTDPLTDHWMTDRFKPINITYISPYVLSLKNKANSTKEEHTHRQGTNTLEQTKNLEFSM